MASSQRGPWSHQGLSGLATLLYIVATLGVLSACAPGETRPSRTPSTPTQTLPTNTLYFAGQHGSVDALQSRNGSLRWHKQLDNEWSTTASLVVFGDVLYVGRQTCPPDGDCQTSPLKGSIEALKASDGTVLWHSRVDVHNDPFQSVQVMAVVNGIVYVEVGGYSSDAAGDVYALRASDGSHLWRYSIDPESVTDPQALQVAVGNAMVYVFKNGGTLHGIVALDANRGSQRWFYAADHLFALVVGS